METNIFTSMIHWLCGFATVLALIWALYPHRHKYENLLLFKKKVGPRYWGRYEGASNAPVVETIEVHQPAHEDACTFGAEPIPVAIKEYKTN